MSRKRPATPAIDPIEKDFMDALQRLRDGAPREKALKANQAKGCLKINVSTVAREAGHSRTLIALESCKFPRVRESIRLAKHGRTAEPRTSSELIDKLRLENADLRVQLKLAQAEAVARFHAKEQAEHEAARWRDAHTRILKKNR
jgi:hypothetical protein